MPKSIVKYRITTSENSPHMVAGLDHEAPARKNKNGTLSFTVFFPAGEGMSQDYFEELLNKDSRVLGYYVL